MKLPTPCGSDCVLAGVNEPQVFSLTVSERQEYSCVFGNRVLKMIPPKSHAPSHPLYLASDHTDSTARRALLERLRDAPCAHVLQVTRVCRCSFESPLVSGEPLRDFGLGPDGHSLTPPALRKPRWPPDVLQSFFRDLTDGLAQLHERGIAHGDPVLLNAYVARGDGAEQALWVDLSSFREATSEARLTDAAAFVELCLWPMLLDCEFSSASLIRDIIEVNSSSPDVLAGLRQALTVERSDYARQDVREQRLNALREHDSLGRSDDYGKIHRRLCSALAAPYVLDYTVTDGSVRFTMSMLEAERTRNAIFEEEQSRLLYLRFQRENEELRKWSSELEKAVAFHNERAEKLQEAVAFHNNRAEALQGAVDFHNNRAEALQQAVEYHNSRAERVEQELTRTAKLLEESQTRARELQQAVDQHSSRAQALENELARAEGDVKTLREELSESARLREEAQARSRELEAAIERYKRSPWYRRLMEPIP